MSKFYKYIAGWSLVLFAFILFCLLHPLGIVFCVIPSTLGGLGITVLTSKE